MLKWLLNLFNKSSDSDSTETETYDLGKVDLIFMFTDDTSHKVSFTGSISVETAYMGTAYNYYETSSAEDQAFDYIEYREDLGWYPKNNNSLVRASEVKEIIIARHPYSITVEKINKFNI